MTEKLFEIVPLEEVQGKKLRADTSPRRPVVLVVDDEHLIADTLVVILNQAGFAASAAYDGEAALEMAAIIPPQLLITDVIMPRMNGVDLAIAMQDAVPDCRILLFSGQAATADLLEKSRRDGYDFEILQKPIYPSDLLAKAKTYMAAAKDTSAEA